MKHIVFLLLMGFFFSLPCPASAQTGGLQPSPLFGRKYKAGDIYRYKLTLAEYHDEKLAISNVAICELRVVKDSNGIFYDEVHWISKYTTRDKDSMNQEKEALAVKPYRISLAANGRMDMPPIEVPEMTEPIQDFNTFFVAISPMMAGIQQLKKKGDSLVIKDPITADFSNGSFILKGQDCIQVRLKLTGTTKKEVSLFTGFFPPARPCLIYLLPEMNTPVVTDTLNNFQMVMPSGKDLYNVQYGREFFFINSTIRKSDGKIIKAGMFNRLNLKLKINCNKEYQQCAFEMPFSERRVLTLELLP